MATKGDRLTDFITSGWYNEVTNRSLRLRHGIPELPQEHQYWYITVINHANVAIPKWTAVSLGSAHLDYDSPLGLAHDQIMFNTADYDDADPDNLAILIEPLPGKIGQSAKALLVGTTWLRVPEALDPEIPFIQIEALEPSGIPGLAYANRGRIEILRTFLFEPPISTATPTFTFSNAINLGPQGSIPAMLFGPSMGMSLAPVDDTGYIGLAIISKKIPASSANIEFTIDSIRTASAVIPAEAPYTGLVIGTVSVYDTSCNRTSLIGVTVDVVDHLGCVFDLSEANLIGIKGYATEDIATSLDPGAPPNTLTPCHWAAKDRCCVPGVD